MQNRSTTSSPWPDGRQFAFTIVDDTDNSTLASVKPVYDYLAERGLRTTKTVWIYPSRDHYTGDSLQDPAYLQFVQALQQKGFEIGLHNVGSGRFSRAEILAGVEYFRTHLGRYPRLHINHANNPDNQYWGYKRFMPPLRWLFKLSPLHRMASGEEPESDLFWGDFCKQHIDYVRNHTFNRIDTVRVDPMMPYRVKRKDRYSNYWFSSSDAHTVTEFNALLTPSSLDRLETQRGLCILYTHFNSGYLRPDGELDPTFRMRVDDIAARNGWFAPASEILDHLRHARGNGRFANDLYLLRLDMNWVLERIAKEIRFRLGAR